MNITDETTTFNCPAVKLLKQLSLEIGQIKKQVNVLTQNQSKILTSDQLLKEFKISGNTLLTWRNQGLAFIKKERKVYFYREDVERFLSRHKRKGF